MSAPRRQTSLATTLCLKLPTLASKSSTKSANQNQTGNGNDPPHPRTARRDHPYHSGDVSRNSGELEEIMEHIDTIRLDRLGDPAFVFGYSITAGGRVTLKEPLAADCKDIRNAIDYARCSASEQPFCIRCKNPLNEQHAEHDGMAMRYTCPNCRTSFIQ